MKILAALMTDGRMSWADLAQLLGLSAPATGDRVRRLEAAGVIRGYAALVDPAAVGQTLAAFVAVSLERPGHRGAFLERVRALPAVLECHHVAGDDDYWLKVLCPDTKALEHLVSDELKGIPGVVRTRTTIVLDTYKQSAAVPLPHPPASGGRS